MMKQAKILIFVLWQYVMVHVTRTKLFLRERDSLCSLRIAIMLPKYSTAKVSVQEGRKFGGDAEVG